ncbi:m7GpppN-mRNA hydrolase-like [Actinia tenebrosa]|uniref:m7GpppN-mRNA hydrolase n=1 Tax=Actinia tenebrosa TaxID=6105 RepID=A0A6P8J8K2_ACTTE|nr:m7GpppN-mRNA hydrolase-like [Actinia tenebrosa]
MASESEPDSPMVYNRSIPAEILEDLCSRFLINIPDEERKDVVRLCFQIELAHWFYIDFHRQENPDLPGCGIKEFTRIIFNHFPFLNKSDEDINQIFANWRKYKLKVPVFGAIIVNETLDKCILVQPAMSKTSWGFPKGKVNKDEDEFECAIREVYEETGFDMRKYAEPTDFIERKIHDHAIRLYVVLGVPENTQFQPQTRGEIRDIRWFKIEHLPAHKKDTSCNEYLNCNPSNFFMVIPFVKDLRRRLTNKTPRPSSQNSISNREEFDSPIRIQLQKLVDKEDARIESERKQAAAERRRKAQQEKFLAQHAMSHPLRDHHQREQEGLRTARDYQSPTGERDSRYSRGSPVLKQYQEQQPTIKILQRPERASSPLDTKIPQDTRDKPSLRYYKTSNVSRSLDYVQDSNPLQKLLHGTSDLNSIPSSVSYGPFSPIYQPSSMSSYGTTPTHPTTRYPGYQSELWKQDHTSVQIEQHMDPLTKLRLLSASATTVHHTKLKTSVQENSNTRTEEKVLFSAPAFVNFAFNRKAILATLDGS